MKDKISYFILGIVIALFAIHAYYFYQVRKVVVTHDATLQQIVNIINQAKQPEK